MEVRTHPNKHTSERVIHSHMRLLDGYTNILRNATVNEVYTVPESALRAPFDITSIEAAQKTAARFKNVTTIFLAGIGGSDTGTRAVYEAIQFKKHANTPHVELFVCNTIDPQRQERARQILRETKEPEQVALVVVSKSGSTMETVANADELYTLFTERFGEKAAIKQTVVITSENSDLKNQASLRGIESILFPAEVGGRFSVFTAAGLVPLSMLGIDIEAFCEGARRGITASVGEGKPSTGAVLAAILFEAYLKDVRVHELFLWNPELETLGKWYRQLMAESIGKERSDETRIGITTSIAIGTTDLHSLGQLIFGGRNDRYTTHVSAPSAWISEYRYGKNSPFSSPLLEGKSPEQIMRAIYGGVRHTYERSELPFCEIEISNLDERELGAFMSLQMTTIMYLGQLFDVNAFDQPAVETYKQETKEILAQM